MGLEAVSGLVRIPPADPALAGHRTVRRRPVGLVPDARAEQVKGLAQGAGDWLVEQADTEGDPFLSDGSADVVLALQEAV